VCAGGAAGGCGGVVAGAVKEGGDDAGGGVGNGGVEGGLVHARVPQDLNIEGGDQAGLNLRGQAGQAAGQFGEQLDQGRVLCGGCLLGEGGQLPGEFLVLVVQVAVVGADAGAHGRGGGVGGVGGQGGQLKDEAVLADADLLEPGPHPLGGAVV